MASIQEYLDLIKNAIYGKDVRQAIHDGIQQCYYDGKAGSTDLEARQRLDSAEGSISSLGSRMSTAEGDIDTLDARVDQIVAPSGKAPSAAEVSDARVGADGVIYTSLGDAVRGQVSDLKSDVNEKADSAQLKQFEKINIPASDNLWDASNTENGLLHTNDTVYTGGKYDDYCYASIGSVATGDVITSFRVASGTIVTRNMDRVVAYDSNGNVLSDNGATSVSSYTVPSGVASLKVTVMKVISNDYFMVLKNHATPTAYIPFAEASSYYLVGDDAFVNYLDFSMVNRVDPTECETGKFIDGTRGVISDNASYFVTNYMPIYKDETLYLYGSYTLKPCSMQTVAAYDENKNLLPGYGTNSGVQSFSYADGIKYIRASVVLKEGSGRQSLTPNTIMVVADQSPITVSTNETSPKLKGEYTRKKVYVYSTDDESAVIKKMVDAYFLNDCDVIFERDLYTFGNVLPNITSLYNLTQNEIPIGNNCRYFFNGATLQATIDLDALGSNFICNLLGTQYKPTNFELHDGILIATDTRYVVHDEAATLVGSYKHLYDNIIMEYHTNISTDTYRKCIGGGTGASGVVEIVGCKFTTDTTEVDVSYHGNAYDVEGAKFMLNVRNCWFSNSIRGGALSEHQTGNLVLVGNSMRSTPVPYDRWDITSFANEIRS